jgi:putative ABC transport system substrate-binding protein
MAGAAGGDACHLSLGGSPVADFDAAFETGLAERGYVFGKNVTKEIRCARGNYDKLSELAKELVSTSLIVASGNVVAVGRATSTISIVFVIASDPVKIGLAKKPRSRRQCHRRIHADGNAHAA